ncbi:hypothetical protein [Halorubrum sp. 48-1-W]|uniref:hypothetical protein n=1 Tax=Halorubrum sp. 48-1-W TaxID=2249761 RepID=UPI000FCACD66|nr:hypothetical protein [Halorubrum sp. 48-1-W]
MTVLIHNDSIWITDGSLYVRGHAYYERTYLDKQEILEKLKGLNNLTTLKDIISNLNGFFSIIIDEKDKTIIAADRMRSSPVFYSKLNNDFLVSDDCNWLKKKMKNSSISSVIETEYITSRFVTGSDTLHSDIKQIQAGEMVVFDKESNTIEHKRHHIHRLSSDEYISENLNKKFENVLENSFSRLVDIADGRPIFIPLSGGYDSRLIALMLKQIGYENVVTYSTNIFTEKNRSIAKSVAENLGFAWLNAELTHNDWGKFQDSPMWDKYFNMAGSLAVLPTLMDILTLIELDQKGKIPENALFVPGHSSLDTMKATPTIFEGQEEIDVDQLGSYIIDQHFKYNEHVPRPKSKLIDRISKNLGINTLNGPDSPVEAFERWRLEERRSKLIINQVRAYDYLNLDWWLPLEDREIYEFWRKVPIEEKRHREFYEDYIENKYISLVGVDRATAEKVAEPNLIIFAKKHFRETSLWPLLQTGYNFWSNSLINYQYRKQFKLNEIYESDPRFGIMSKDTVESNFHNQQHLLYSLIALAEVGRIDLQ